MNVKFRASSLFIFFHFWAKECTQKNKTTTNKPFQIQINNSCKVKKKKKMSDFYSQVQRLTSGLIKCHLILHEQSAESLRSALCHHKHTHLEGDQNNGSKQAQVTSHGVELWVLGHTI